MGSLSIWHWLLVLGVGVLLFGGKGKISSVMGDFAKGIKAFKSGMKEPEEETATTPPAQVTPPGAAASTAGAAASPAHVGVGGAAAPVGAGGGVGDRPRDHA